MEWSAMHNPSRTAKLRPSVIAVAVAIAASANAADETGKWYFNPEYGYTFQDNDRPVDDGDHFAFGFGRHLTEHWSVELNGLWTTFDNEDTGGELDQTAYSLDALTVFGREKKVSPYVTFGAGY